MPKSIANAKRGQVWTGQSMVFTKAVDLSNGSLVKKRGYQPIKKMAGARYKVESRRKKSAGGKGG